MSKSQLITLLLTAAVVIDGAIRKAGTEIEAPENVAKNLLTRGKATLVGENASLNEDDDEAAEEAAKDGQ